jgi:hypothetical protein
MLGVSEITKLIRTFENIDFEKLIEDTENVMRVAEESLEVQKKILEQLEQINIRH